MATLFHIPTFHSLSSPKLPISSHSLSPYPAVNRRHNHRFSAIFASSVKKPLRASRKSRSDEDLRNDIKEFLSAAGLPQNHVPSMKELSLYGRQDLANIVRRRGYKFIGQLLEASSTANLIESNVETSTSSCISTKEHTNTSGEDLDDENQKSEDQPDIIEQLKFLLNQKALELNQFKLQIEKLKLALSVLHAKADLVEITAQELISKTDIELLAAKETLLGLKKVEIQYSGEGETVELAGSFNGWQHKITMEQRETGVWQTVLWLYPGIYEIKFVVGDDWRVDSGMETISRNGVPNNIVRVDRSDSVDDC